MAEYIEALLSAEFREIQFILILPVLSGIILFSRQIIGLKTFGVYGPLILSISYLENPFWISLFISYTLIFFGIFGDKFIRALNFSYVSNTSMDLYVLALTALAILSFFIRNGYYNVNITIPFIITTFIVKQYNKQSDNKSWDESFWLLFNTLLIAVIGYWTSVWFLQNILEWYHAVAVFCISLGISILISIYNGLRLMELLRFKRLLFQKIKQSKQKQT